MKNKFTISTFGLAVLLLLGTVACTRHQDAVPETVPGDRTAVSVTPVLAAAPAGTGLSYSLYIFSKPSESTGKYTLYDSISPLQDGALFGFPNSDLNANVYRFLFVATPAPAAEIRVVQSGDAPRPVKGMSWQDLRIGQSAPALSGDNYYGITEITGTDILRSTQVRGTLTRLVGQPVLDLYRIGDGDISTPENLDSANVLSVLDRVYQIDIAYSGQTSQIGFGTGNAPEPGTVAPAEASKIISPVLTGFGVAVPQIDKGLEAAAAGTTGSVRIMGPYLLPSPGNVQMTLAFHYYDTTPICGNNHPGEPHDYDCYDRRTLTLDLPAETAPAGLPIAADHFTLNKGGIRCDRIIDLPQGAGMSIVTEWNQ